MANTTCAGTSGSTYATVNRGYGCLSSVPTANSVPYNCFLPPTNMSYYQNFPFYNGPCGTVAGSSTSSPSAPAPNGNCCCCCCCAPQPGSSGSQNSVPSTPLTPAIPTGKCCYPWFFPWCCPCDPEEEEEEEEEDMNSANCCFPWFCNPCCPPSGSGAPCPNWPCKPCKPSVCCQPAALIATSNGQVTPAAGGTVPLTLTNSTSSALTVMGDTITVNCTGTYLVTLTSNIPQSSAYNGTVSVALNGTPVATTTQSFAASTAAHDTTQAIVKVNKGGTLTITTSGTSAAIVPTGGTNLFTITVVRIA